MNIVNGQIVSIPHRQGTTIYIRKVFHYVRIHHVSIPHRQGTTYSSDRKLNHTTLGGE